jgi:hypothetical protein
VRVFRQKFTLEDAIGSHACSLEANTRVTNGIPLGSSLLLPVCTVNCAQTLKVYNSPNVYFSDRLGGPDRTKGEEGERDEYNPTSKHDGESDRSAMERVNSAMERVNATKGNMGLYGARVSTEILHSRMPLNFTPLLRLKHWHAMRAINGNPLA